MTQRLFDGEERADSITTSAPSPRLRTQASNFSLCRRSAALAVMTMVSILNWRKHSESRAWDEGFNPTSAVRAADFRVVRIGASERVVAKALSMIGEDSTFEIHSGGGRHAWKDPKDQRAKYQSRVTFSETAGDGTLRRILLWNEELVRPRTLDPGLKSRSGRGFRRPVVQGWTSK